MKWQIRDRVLSTDDHPLIMGILNVTPDSFSDGGHHSAIESATSHGLAMWHQGADIIDVGGESTRPGAAPIDTSLELQRVLPVVRDLVARGVVVSVDTMKAEVAASAIAAGAHIINDVTALGDPDMAAVCAEAGVGVVLMHMQGDPLTMQDDPQYADVVGDVLSYLTEAVDRATNAGVARSNLCIDPGIGFGKTFDHNLELLANVDRFAALSIPVLIGASRKGFLGEILRDAGLETLAAERDVATAATVALAVNSGASIVRVHNVGHGLQAARTAGAIVRASLRRN